MSSHILKKIVCGLATSGALFPLFAFAQTAGLTQPKNLTEAVNNFLKILNGDFPRSVGIIQFIIGFCFFGLLIGILRYASAGGDEERLGKAKSLIIYGLIGLFIAFSFWGIVSIFAATYLGV